MRLYRKSLLPLKYRLKPILSKSYGQKIIKTFLDSTYLLHLLFFILFFAWSILLINHYRYIKTGKRPTNPYIKFIQTTISPHYQNQLIDDHKYYQKIYQEIDYNCPENPSDENVKIFCQIQQKIKTTQSPTIKEPKKRKNLIAIKGERHSGTNWLRQLIKSNCPEVVFELEKEWKNVTKTIIGKDKKPFKITKIEEVTTLDADGKYGWKHGLLNSNFSQQIEEQDLVIILFRNWTSWLPKMRLENYQIHKIPKNGLNWNSFLDAEFPPADNPSYNSHFQPLEQKYSNAIAMRNAKYKNWLSLSKDSNKTNRNLKQPSEILYVRYEDLLDEKFAEEFFTKTLRLDYNLDCYDNYLPHNGYAKYGQANFGNLVKKDEKKFHEKMSYVKKNRDAIEIPNDLMETVKKQLNVPLESELGYYFG